MNLSTLIKFLTMLVLIGLSTLFPVQGLNPVRSLNNPDLSENLLRSMSSPDLSGNLLAHRSFSECGNDYTIQFSSREMSLKKALDELLKHKEFNIVYGGKEIDVDVPIVFTSRTLKLSEAFKQIEKQAPVEFIIDNKHIIVKKRKLETGYYLKGRVVDLATNEGLVAANVLIAGTTYGVVTDNNGNFSMHLAPNSYKLIFRYVGYVEQSIRVNLFEDVQLKTLMEVKENQIQSVDVTGNFSIIENIERGRTIETIDSKVIGRLNTNNVNDALHGRLNGVWTTKVSGAPGDHHRIRIRGINSIFGSSDPLYVVDGSIIPIVNFDNLGIADLNSHDIEKITVLKDASSTALYGNLGSNGVILIETKKGGGRQPSYNFQIKQGFQRFDKRYDLMGAEEFFSTLHLSDDLIRTNYYTVFPNAQPPKYELYPRYLDSLGNALTEKDYQDELFGLGMINEYQLSGTGNYKSIDYYFSGNYYNHNGVIINSNYNKYTFTANLSKVIEDKMSVRLLYKGSHQENKNTLDNYLGNNVIFKGINYEPAYRATPDSFFNKPARLYYNDITKTSVATLADHLESPDELFYEHNKIKTDNANALNLQGFYNLNKEITFRALMSLTIRKQVNYSNIKKSISNYQYPAAYIEEANYFDYGTGNRLKSDETFIYFCQHYDVNYTKQTNRHLLNVLLRYRNFKDNAYWAIDSVSNVYYDKIDPTDDVFLRGSQAIFGEKGSVLRSINSGILNVNYNFGKKYFLSFIANYETIRENVYLKKTDLFYSLAFNWDLAKEMFIHMPGFVDAFNLSANIGRSGNFPLNSMADDLFVFSSKYTANGQVADAVYISNLANAHLTQESVFENNLGAEISLFKERFVLSADFYKKYYSNLLIKRTTPLYYGGGFVYQNIGEMKNEGVELSLDVIPLNNPNWYWDMRMGLSTNKQTVTKLLDNTPINFNNTDVLIPDFIAKENEVLGSIIGYKYLGKWTEIDQDATQSETTNYFNHLGLAYLKTDTVDLKNLTEKDKTIIGNSIPDFTFHWINNVEYKNFSVEMMWYGSIGVDKYNATKASTYISGVNSDVRNIVLDSLNYNHYNIFYESSYFVEDASFIRLKTLTFSYRPEKKIASKIGMKFSLSLENLVTLTRYSGYDPEAAIYTNNNFTDNAIDKGGYPNPKGVYFSINMTY